MVKQKELEKFLSSAEQDLHERQFESSIEKSRTVLAADPDNLEACYLLGIALLRTDQFEEAEQYLVRITESEYFYLHTQQAYMMLGYSYANSERYLEAEAAFTRALQFNFNNEIAYAALGHIYYKLDRVEESLEALQAALEIDPKNYNARNTMAFVLCESGQDIERALQEALSAVKAEPKNYYFLDTLGWVYYQSGKEILARETLKRALELAPENEEIMQHLREVLKIS